MKLHLQLPLFLLFALLARSTLGAVFYVDVNSTNPTPPYASWSMAATDIQSAVNLATNGDLVLVNPGVYQSAGYTAPDGTLTCVVVTNAVTLQSVNGAAVTSIDGSNTMRCLYLPSGAALSGFTLINGSADSGAGVYCEATNDAISDCLLTNNNASLSGGGSYQGTLTECTMSDNSAQQSGGAAYLSALSNCILTNNSAAVYGGGAYQSDLTNCLVIGNSSAQYGGGVSTCIINNCTIVYNYAGVHDGGIDFPSTPYNCIIYYNASYYGIDANYDAGMTLNYCCTTPTPSGVGNVTAAPLFVNIPNNFHLQSNSPCINIGNNAYVALTNDLDGNPRIIDGVVDMGAYEYQAPVPLTAAIETDNTNVATGFPLQFQAVVQGGIAGSISWDFGDGTVISNQPSASHAWSAPGLYPVTLLVVDAFGTETASASLTVNVVTLPVTYVSANGTNPVAPYISWETAATNIQDAVDASYLGGTVLVTNGVYQTGSRVSPDGGTSRVVVTNAITLQSVNGSAVTVINGGNVVRCLYLGPGGIFNGFTLTNGNAGYYTDFAGGGALCGAYYSNSVPNVLFSDNELIENCLIVSNTAGGGGGGGVRFGTVSNCVLTLNRTPGPGGGTESCVSYNCVFSNNYAFGDGGGAAGGISTLNNCMLIDNVSVNGEGGGGVFGSTLNNCLVISNTAVGEAGGADDCVLNNCTVVGNNGLYGVEGGSGYPGFIPYAKNCIVYYNGHNENFNIDGYFTNCCIPGYTGRVGSFTNAPLFVNPAAGDFHLQSNSPCINAGNNSFVTTTVDFDGNPRIVGGTVDIGAYEYQTPGSVLSYAWAQQYGLPTDGSVDYADLDGTKFDVYQDWIAGLNPTNAASVLAMLPPTTANTSSGIMVSWQSVTGIYYDLQRATNLAAPPAFSVIQSNLVGHAGTTSYTDTTATNGGPYFYRVSVQ